MKLRTRISIVCLLVAALPGATTGCASSLCFRGPFRRGQCTTRGSSNPCLKVFSDQFEQVSEFTDAEDPAPELSSSIQETETEFSQHGAGVGILARAEQCNIEGTVCVSP